MRCEICRLGPARHNVTVYRINPVGETGRWRCLQHLGAHKVDPETRELVEVLEAPAQEKNDD